MSEDNKIHIDSDWKAEAQAEKERLTAEQSAKSDDDANGKKFPPRRLQRPYGPSGISSHHGIGSHAGS